ncbi:PREDICTED: vacuolar protein sorting-associated protein 13C-like [Priapulus caudatus]|uniref:Vacuolar protein sorting-associated protein 13C-like n=1 Tax=Priapulus caudatus TaxID=37621 RepID=A0ABM1ERY0_PRICU|nr:PREDICTED: vacuolar protein sorting-associated protein 13C-like [Priapulus caudatus]
MKQLNALSELESLEWPHFLCLPKALRIGSCHSMDWSRQAFRAESYAIGTAGAEMPSVAHDEFDGEMKKTATGHAKSMSDSSEHDESPSESEMTVIRRRFASSSVRKHRLETKASFASQHGDSSDSDADGGNIFEKIIGSFGHMFSSDSSGGEASESETEAGSKTTEGQPRDEAGEAIDETKPVFLKKGEASIEEDDKDEIDASMAAVDMATYFLVDSRDSLQLNVTPTLILLLQELLEALSERPDAEVKSNKKPPSLTVLNKLGVETDVQVRGDEETAGDVCVLQGTEYDNAPDLMDLNPETELIKAEEAEEKVDYGLDSEDPSYYDYMSNLSSAAMVSHAFSFDSDDMQPFASCSTRKVALRVNGFEAVDWQLPRRAGTHMLVMSPKQGDILYSVLATLDVTHGNRTVTLRSPLQVHNCTSYAVNVYCKVSELANHQRPAGLDEGSVGEYGLLTMLAPGQLYDVPLYVAYHCSLYMKPAHLDYEMSYNGIWWSDLAGAKDRSTYLACLATQWENRNFLIKVVCNDGVTVRLPGNLGKQVPNYMLKLHAPVVLHNYLPHHLRYSLEAKAYKDNVKCEFDVDLDAGQKKALHNIDMLSAESHQLYLEAPNYLNMHWTGVLDLSTSMDEMRGVNMTPEFEADTGTSKQFTIGVHTINTGGLEIYLYAPYWLVNKTSLPLQFRGSGSEVVYENLTSHDPLLFRFKKHRRKKVKVRVYNSRWSHSFSLDTVGSTGMVICADRERERKYRFLVQIQLSKLNLTKIVTILPFFLIVNNTPTPLRYMEHNENADLWMDIAPSQCCPFWPDTDSMRMYVAQHQSLACSQGFVVNQQHSTVLRMSSGGALRVDVSGGTESPMTVSFAPYQHGDAPILIQNVCDDIFIRFNQKCQGQVTLLKPNQQVLYTWDDPASERTIIWNVYNRKKPGYPAFVNKDGHGEVRMHIQSVKFRAPNGSVSKEPVMSSSTDEDDSEQEVIPLSELRKKMRTDKVIVYWVSFLDGPQRVLLLTQDERVAREARRLCESEKSNWELFLSLGNVSMSLINSSYEEVALLSCIGSSAKWQVEINGKWKTLNVELSLWLEDKWRAYQSSAELKDYIEVDFSRMQMVKPFFGQLCRTYSPAVFFTCRKSEHQTCIGATLHRLQIDNQLNDAVFTTVLSPILNKQYVAKQGGSGPFLEFTMLSRKLPENNGMSVQYLKALVKDFSLKLDKGFLLSVWHIFSPWQTPKSETLQLQSDLNDIHAQLKDVASQQVAAQKPCIVFEYVHLSPLKFEVSLSLRGIVHQEQGESDGLVSSHVDFFLGSVGATILDIKDVEMKWLPITFALAERR